MWRLALVVLALACAEERTVTPPDVTPPPLLGERVEGMLFGLEVGLVGDLYATDAAHCQVLEGRSVPFLIWRGSDEPGASVRYETRPGTAEPGNDYEGHEGWYGFVTGERESEYDWMEMNIRTVSDSVPEPDETFFVWLKSPSSGYSLHGPSRRVVVTILDDDTPRTDPAGGRLVWPLDVGNRWHFRGLKSGSSDGHTVYTRSQTSVEVVETRMFKGELYHRVRGAGDYLIRADGSCYYFLPTGYAIWEPTDPLALRLLEALPFVLLDTSQPGGGEGREFSVTDHLGERRLELIVRPSGPRPVATPSGVYHHAWGVTIWRGNIDNGGISHYDGAGFLLVDGVGLVGCQDHSGWEGAGSGFFWGDYDLVRAELNAP